MALVTTVKTITFSVDDVSANPYTVITKCRKIRIGPADGASTYDYRAPTSTDSAVRKFSGEVTIFERPSPGQYQVGDYGDPGHYKPGDVPGYFTLLAGLGTKTFQAEEFL